MSIKIMNEVIERAPVEQGTLLVLIMLADSADERSRECWPSVANVARRSRLSERQVQYCLKELAANGVISIIPNAGRSGTNLYRITHADTWGGAIIAGVQSTSPGGVQSTSPGGVKPIAPEPSIEPSLEPSLFGSDEPQATSPKQKNARETVIDEPAERFSEFWSAFPSGRKTDKPKALEVFRKIVTGKHKAIPKTDATVIISAAKRYAATQPDPQYTPMPTTWLNGQRWDQFQAARPAPAEEPGSQWWGGRNL